MVAATKIDTADKAFIRNKNFKAIPVIDDEEDGTYGVPLLTKEEYEARSKEFHKSIKEGKTESWKAITSESVKAFFEL
jgi:CBS-domain-containing membrane protein